MLFPEPMTEIEIIVPAKDILPVTKELSGLGVFHQTDGSYLNTQKEDGAGISWQTQALAYAGLERRLQSIMTTLEIKDGAIAANTRVPMVEAEAIRPVVESIEQEVKRVNDQLLSEQKKIDQLKNTSQQLEPIIDIDLDISTLRNPRYIFSIMGVMPDENIERLQTSLARIPFIFVPLHQENHRAVVWLGGSRNNADIIERAARSAYLNPLILPEGYQGTAAQIVTSLQTSIADAQKKIGELKAELARLKEVRQAQLLDYYWKTRAGRMLSDAILRYGRLRYTYVIVGWVVSSSLGTLSQRLKQVCKEIIIENYPASQDGAKQNVPVSIKNPKGFGPFQMLVMMYARPRYNEIDPTILIAATFPLIFGAMFGDVAHGAILLALGLLVASQRVRALRGLASLGGLVAACGITSIIFGVLYGSYLGIEDAIKPLWITPKNNIMTILIITILAGVVLLSLGLLIGIYNAWRARDWPNFYFANNGLAGLVLYWSILGLGAGIALVKNPVFTAVFIVSGVVSGIAIMFSDVFKRLVANERPLIEGGIGTYAIQAIFELFESLISFLSNSLSYVRIGAFAVAHGFLSGVIFTMADLVSPAGHNILWFLVVALGTLFIVGFEGLIVGIQTMRLEYYEFFSKFFKGGGLKYEPLLVNTTTEK